MKHQKAPTIGTRVVLTGTEWAGATGTVEGVTYSLIAVSIDGAGAIIGVPADCVRAVTA